MNKLKQHALALTLTLFSLNSVNAENKNVILNTPTDYQVMDISPNGKWACGVYIDFSNTPYAFRWNLESGTIDLTGTTSLSMGLGISNDGVMSGVFTDTEATENHAGIELPGFYKDGKWHHLEMPTGNISDGMGGYISPDGHYVCGTACVNNVYKSYIWKDGKIYRELKTNRNSSAFAISPDGQMVTGWDDGYEDRHNRVACLWQADGNLRYFTDSPDYYTSPWNYGRNFSPDGNKMLYWGGWELNADSTELYLYSIYDIQSGEVKKVKATKVESDLEFFDISNNETLVGSENGKAVIYHDGILETAEKYLLDRGVDLGNFDDFYSGSDYIENSKPLVTITSISEDEKVLAIIYNNKYGYTSTMIVKIDQDVTHCAPAEVTARQLNGINVVGVEWKLAKGAEMGKGFHVYRNGKKLTGFIPTRELSYYDKNVPAGTYEYTVKAVGTDGVETEAESVTIEVVDNTPSAPMQPFARQKGLNDVHVTWNSPMSNVYTLGYFDHNLSDLQGISSYQIVTMETGVRFDNKELANYNGCKISEVSFYPMGEHGNWIVNVYCIAGDGTMELIGTQAIDQQLQIGKRNTVKLDTPIELPASNIIVAIQADVAESGLGQKVMGADFNKAIAGYSDLLRQKEEPAFYSVLEVSQENGYPTTLTWSIEVGLQPEGYSDDENKLKEYIITTDNSKTINTTENTCVIEGLADGTHDIEIKAVYADGSTSLPVSTTAEIKSNYKAINDVKVESINETSINATWDTPMNDDATNISYTKKQSTSVGMQGVSSKNYEFAAAVVYRPAMLRGYDGYKINSLRFYPMTDASFTLSLYENNNLIYEVEVEDFEMNKWNDVTLEEALTINENSEYRLVVDVFDPLPEEAALGVEQVRSLPYYSDLFSIDRKEWESLSDYDINANWMMGLNIVTPDQQPMPINGYDIRIDNKKCNTEMVTDTKFSYDFGTYSASRHSIIVDAYYEASEKTIQGGKVYFTLSTSGIKENMIADIKLKKGDNLLTVEGENVKSITAYSSSGAMVAYANSNTININNFASGTYIIKINVGGNIINRKIRITDI